ncbi:hypothetical protein EB796_024704 [Bugula neritina]|uniref:EF-hand domain-containing protein n=1 Tax=Bugula neritina TaxID=10212 RepID=A0A7J7IST8_BUGNE|nr:hypothetical protein EB796_024704 [Bugula neritina]
MNPTFDSDTSLSSTPPPPQTVHLDDMSAKCMARLEYVFKIAEEEEGPLCFNTFKMVLQAVLGHQVSERELMMMFMKIDSNCDEVITWSEYISFLLCELQKKDHMQSTKNDNPLPDDVTSTIISRHHNFIIRFGGVYNNSVYLKKP